MAGLIIDHDTDYVQQLLILFPRAKIVDYRRFDPVEAETHDYIVLSGGPIHISSPTDLVEEKEFLRNTRKPVFGICLGLEILCVMHGSKLRELDRGTRDGFHELDIHGERFNIHHHHGWYIRETPDEFVELVRTGDIVDAIEHKTRPIFAVQGHPEVSGEDGVRLRDLFIKRYLDIEPIPHRYDMYDAHP